MLPFSPAAAVVPYRVNFGAFRMSARASAGYISICLSVDGVFIPIPPPRIFVIIKSVPALSLIESTFNVPSTLRLPSTS